LCQDCQADAESYCFDADAKDIKACEDKARLAYLGVPPRLLGMSFRDFSPSNGTKDAYEYCKEYYHRLVPGGSPENIALFGPVGSGKTMLASLIIMSNNDGYLVNETAFMKDLRDEDFKKAEGLLKNHMNRCFSDPIIVLDDFFSEPLEGYWRTFLEERVYLIANERYDKGLPTIITSNSNEEEFRAVVGDRIASRLLGGAKILNVGDVDHRELPHKVVGWYSDTD
jgi:DNA replication protein DnaC